MLDCLHSCCRTRHTQLQHWDTATVTGRPSSDWLRRKHKKTSRSAAATKKDLGESGQEMGPWCDMDQTRHATLLQERYPEVRLEPGRTFNSTWRRANCLPRVGAPGQSLSSDRRTTRPPHKPHTAQSLPLSPPPSLPHPSSLTDVCFTWVTLSPVSASKTPESTAVLCCPPAPAVPCGLRCRWTRRFSSIPSCCDAVSAHLAASHTAASRFDKESTTPHVFVPCLQVSRHAKHNSSTHLRLPSTQLQALTHRRWIPRAICHRMARSVQRNNEYTNKP